MPLNPQSPENRNTVKDRPLTDQDDLLTIGATVAAAIDANIEALEQEMDWLEDLVAKRVETLMAPKKVQQWTSAPKLIRAPDLLGSSYRDLVMDLELSYAERLLLILTFCAGYDNDRLLLFRSGDAHGNERSKAVGGRMAQGEGSPFRPTLQTLLFLLAGNDKHTSLKYLLHLRKRDKLFSPQILHLIGPEDDINYMPLKEVRLEAGYYDYFLFSEKPRLDQGEHFPARLLETDKTFDDLVLPETTRNHLKPAMDYLRHRRKVLGRDDGHRKFNGGHVMMLYGPPGTGKTLTAAVMGQELGVETYAIELSQVVSKYIGETEKNIDRIFERVRGKDCILFFDEADALFGKRTEVKDARDRYANQETSHLLQKIEQCTALVVLASNYRQNLDDAFVRRILTYVHLPPPEQQQRMHLWEKAIPEAYAYAPSDLPELLADSYPLTGANIANIIKLSCFDAEAAGSHLLDLERVEHFIQKELLKENRQAPQKSHRAAPLPKPTAPAAPAQREQLAQQYNDFYQGQPARSMSEAEARRRGPYSDSPGTKQGRRGRGKGL